MQTIEEKGRHRLLARFHLDGPLLIAILCLCVISLVTLYSASGQNITVVLSQAKRILIAMGIMFLVAQFDPNKYQKWSLPLYLINLLLLVAVYLSGDVGKGAQRWLDLGFIQIQPSEISKIVVPLILAWFCNHKQLPVRFSEALVSLLILAIPCAFVFIQPDLGTSILIASSGIFVIFLAGIRWRYLLASFILTLIALPTLWFTALKDYQKDRIKTFLNPELDPLNTGYHIIQSKIAIGSGGLRGKGWLQGTQSHLEFLPERHTDFIFAVFSEEFGFIGVIALIALYAFIVFRGLQIATHAQTTFGRLLCGSLTLTFFIYVLVNIGMVSGLLPVVGIPLPLVSFGGTSLVTMMASFGMIMAIATHRRLHTHY